MLLLWFVFYPNSYPNTSAHQQVLTWEFLSFKEKFWEMSFPHPSTVQLSHVPYPYLNIFVMLIRHYSVYMYIVFMYNILQLCLGYICFCGRFYMSIYLWVCVDVGVVISSLTCCDIRWSRSYCSMHSVVAGCVFQCWIFFSWCWILIYQIKRCFKMHLFTLCDELEHPLEGASVQVTYI